MDDDVIRDHMERPFHYGILPNASLVGTKRNPACGDEVTLSLLIINNVILEAWHQVRGCLLCKASASILCEHLQGLPLDHANAISENDAIAWTGIEISPGRRACCALPVLTLLELLSNGRSRIAVD